MSWAYGTDNNGREIGYHVRALCDGVGCHRLIDRGLDYRCGDLGSESDSSVPGCGNYFCGKHLFGDQRSAPGGGFCEPCLAAIGEEEEDDEE